MCVFGSPFCSCSDYLCFIFMKAKQVCAPKITFAWTLACKFFRTLPFVHGCEGLEEIRVPTLTSVLQSDAFKMVILKYIQWHTLQKVAIMK